MAEESWLSVKNALPIIVAVDTAWLGALTWWVTSRNHELSCRITELEKENKAFKKCVSSSNKQILNLQKQLSSLQKQLTKQQQLLTTVTDTLEEHNSRLGEFKNNTIRGKSSSTHRGSHVTHVTHVKPQSQRRPIVHSRSSSESGQSSKSEDDGSISSGDYENMYNTLSSGNKGKPKR
jgi:septal ring factor EnvC (AmiA/AmiB activator)